MRIQELLILALATLVMGPTVASASVGAPGRNPASAEEVSNTNKGSDTLETEVKEEVEPDPTVDTAASSPAAGEAGSTEEKSATLEAKVKEEPRPGPTTDQGVPGPAADELDLAKLEARLRATQAIGFFTKLALRNEVKDLMGRFRRFHAGKSKASLADLHEQFDLLLMKIVTLLQDNDPELFRAIVNARDLLWNKLADPESFAQLQLSSNRRDP